MTTNDQNQTMPELFKNGRLSPVALVPITDGATLRRINAPYPPQSDHQKKFQKDVTIKRRLIECLLGWIVTRKSGSVRRWPMLSTYGRPTSIDDAEELFGSLITLLRLDGIMLFVEITNDTKRFTAHVTTIEQMREIAAYRFKHSCTVRFITPFTLVVMV